MPRNANYEDMLAANAVTHKAIKAPKKLKKLELTPAHLSDVHDADGNKMHVVEHRFDNSGPGPYHENEAHHFGKDEGEKLIDHVREFMKIGEPKAGETKEEKSGEGEDEKTTEGDGAAGAAY